MNIMVFDVPAEHGGALTILKHYYDEAVKDKDNNWYFVISTPSLIETDNLKVLQYRWVKKSWVHRLYFDTYVAPRLIKQCQVDEILSLQNVIVPRVKVKQTLYLHQSLPFIKKRYRITENLRYWVYQNIISSLIFNSVRKADSIIVQTNWMKDACVQQIKVDPSKIIMLQPSIKIVAKRSYKQEDENNKLFFYPASPLPYKNHNLIVEVAKLLKQQGIENYSVIFTIVGNENSNVKKMYDEVQEKDLPIVFIGRISLDEVYEYYSKSILIFPSYIETFGLPMLEARGHCSPILVSNCSFSYEILEGYEKVTYFNPFKYEELANAMKSFIIA